MGTLNTRDKAAGLMTQLERDPNWEWIDVSTWTEEMWVRGRCKHLETEPLYAAPLTENIHIGTFCLNCENLVGEEDKWL